MRDVIYFGIHAVWHMLDKTSSNLDSGIYFGMCGFVADAEVDRIDLLDRIPGGRAHLYCKGCQAVTEQADNV